MEILEHIPLGERTTLGVGGEARYYCRAESEDDILEARGWAAGRLRGTFVLGGGSNLVVADAEYKGLVIEVGLRGIRDLGEGLIEAGAGESWDGLVAWSVERGLAGIECLSGIPGTVGATPVQNVGAYGQEVAGVVESVRAFDVAGCGFVELGAGECGFGYRGSRFNRGDKGRFIITAVRYRLRTGGAATLAYPELQRRFDGRTPKLGEVREAVLAIRRAKGMVIEAGAEWSRSAGSFFKNPVVAAGRAAEIAGAHSGMPQFPTPAGVKLSAGWLIEQAGCGRGFRLGEAPARLSPRHALAIITEPGAATADVVELARRVRGAVEERFGVRLTVEPEQIGFSPGEEI